MDKIRIATLGGFELPIGTPITFEGKEVGHVLRSNDVGVSECVINSDIVHHMIRQQKCEFSLEVIRK